MVQTYFENIDIAISHALAKSKSSIDIASAWFTHYGLIKVINNLALMNSVKVRIIINDDSINAKCCSFYEKLIESGVQVYICKGSGKNSLMHNKFAVIDSCVVITGSFNWTKSAESNLENILIAENAELAAKYTNEFQRILQLSREFHESHISTQLNTYLHSLDEAKIWEFLKHFHEVEYNPSPQRIWRAMCGTTSKSIHKKTSLMPFFDTIHQYSDRKGVLSDLKIFFTIHQEKISSEFRYQERGWNEIDFPGNSYYNYLTIEEKNKIKLIKLSDLHYGKKWSNIELDLFSSYILKTNDLGVLSKLLGRSKKSVISKAKRVLYEDKALYSEWLKCKRVVK